jgi:hypothetical protein
LLADDEGSCIASKVPRAARKGFSVACYQPLLLRTPPHPLMQISHAREGDTKVLNEAAGGEAKTPSFPPKGRIKPGETPPKTLS